MWVMERSADKRGGLSTEKQRWWGTVVRQGTHDALSAPQLPYLRCRSPGEKGQTSDSAPYRLLYSQLPCSLATTVTK